MSDQKSTSNAVTALLVSIVATVAIFYVPYGRTAGYPLVLLSTLAHEMGHGVMGMLVGGSFQKFVIYSDGSGVATTAFSGGANRIQGAMVSAGGLIGPAFVGMILLMMGKKDKLNKGFLAMLGLGLLLSVILIVDTLFARVFVGLVGGVTLLIGVRAPARIAQLYSYFIAVQLGLSVFSRGDYLFMEEAQTGAGPAPSDVANMAKDLFLPYWFWGGICGLISLLFLTIGLYSVVRSERGVNQGV